MAVVARPIRGRYYCKQDKEMQYGFNDRFDYQLLSTILLGADRCHSILKSKDE